MVMSCKTFLEEGDNVCTQSLSVVESKFNECLQLHREYHHQFQTLREHLGNRREFSETIVFGKFNKFADRLRKIVEVFTVLQTYRGLRDSKIEGDLLAQNTGYSSVCANLSIAASPYLQIRYRPDGDETICSPSMAISVLFGDQAIPTSTPNDRQPMTFYSRLIVTITLGGLLCEILTT